jgi:hypothetical protein
VIWRYDPIYLSECTSLDFHRRNFQTLAQALMGYSQRCVVSLFDDYAKSRSRLSITPSLVPLAEGSDSFREAVNALMPDLAAMAEDHQFELVSCAEDVDLQPYGIYPGKCVDDDLIRRVFGLDLHSKKDPGQRLTCQCLPSQDIGCYDTCLFGCQYCYANRSFERARRYFSMHESDRETL